MIKCAILSIGEELLEGSVIDTNSGYIARRLSDIDVSPHVIIALPDDMDIIAGRIKEVMKQYPLIITTGGLGPTFDDLTIASVAQALDLPLIKDDFAEKHLRERLSKYDVVINENQLHQAMFPEGAEVIPNPNGTACAMRITIDGCTIISMPGVPSEMYAILSDNVIPHLEKTFALRRPYQADLHFINLPESYADNVIREFGVPEGVKCIINASTGKIIVKIRADKPENALPLVEKLKKDLKKNYVGDSDKGIAQITVALLKEKCLTLSVAESCTGGSLGGEITGVAGASAVFTGGVISYDNRIKSNVLNVSEKILRHYGAVSKECATAMAEGVKNLMQTDCALSITGIAGPDGGTPEKPVGTVYIATMVKDKTECKLFHFTGDRTVIRARAVNNALGMLIGLINS